MKRYIFILVMAAAAAFVACKSDPVVPATVDQREILPLAAGNSWNFLRSWIDTNGVTVDSISLQMTVGQPESLGTERAYPVSNFPFVFVNPSPLLCANKAGGLYNVIPGPDPLSRAFAKVFAYPTSPGELTTIYGYTIRTGTVSEQVVVPSGSYTCVRYDILQSDSLLGQLYVAPGTGIVKSWKRYYGVSALVDELRSFQLH